MTEWQQYRVPVPARLEIVDDAFERGGRDDNIRPTETDQFLRIRVLNMSDRNSVTGLARKFGGFFAGGGGQGWEGGLAASTVKKKQLFKTYSNLFLIFNSN